MAPDDGPAAEKVLTAGRIEKLLAMGSGGTALAETKEIHLEGLEADRLASGALAVVGGLFKLHLQKNRLATLPKRAFHGKEEDKAEKKRGSRNLTFLDLSENRLDELAVDRLVKWNIGNLITLKLAGNKLTAVPGAALERLSNLRALVLNDNQLARLEIPCEMPHLNTLILSGNQLVDLGPGCGLDRLPELKKLSASKNNLTSVPALLAEKNPLLAELRLSGNKIASLVREDGVDLVWDAFTKLAVVDLSSNLLAEADTLAALAKCASLLNVSVAGNTLYEGLARVEREQLAAGIIRGPLKAAAHLRLFDNKPLPFFGVPARAGRKATSAAAIANKSTKGQKPRGRSSEKDAGKDAGKAGGSGPAQIEKEDAREDRRADRKRSRAGPESTGEAAQKRSKSRLASGRSSSEPQDKRAAERERGVEDGTGAGGDDNDDDAIELSAFAKQPPSKAKHSEGPAKTATRAELALPKGSGVEEVVFERARPKASTSGSSKADTGAPALGSKKSKKQKERKSKGKSDGPVKWAAKKTIESW